MVKAEITHNYCYLTMYTQKPEETVRVIVMMWFINGIPFTFEELPQAVQDLDDVRTEADWYSLEYTDIDLYNASEYLIMEQCHPLIFDMEYMTDNYENIPE